jgi:hypothetical protein
LRIDTQGQIAFVDSLPLAPPAQVHVGRAFSGHLLPAMRGMTADGGSGEQTAYVAKGSLVSFVAGVDQAARADVLDALLFAQLGADERFDRERDFDHWHRFYLLVMQNVGWTVEVLDFAPPVLERFTVGELGLALLQTNASAAEQRAADATLASARHRVPAVFDQSSHSSDAGCFHVGTCSQLAQRIETTLICIHFHTGLRVTQLLKHVFDRRTTRYGASIYRCSLDLAAHAPVALQIRKKLADDVGVFIHELAL